MDMPRPGEAHWRLSKLVGEWTGPETMHPAPWDPVGGPASGRVVNSWMLDGFGVVQQYEQVRGGAPSFSGYGVFWFDPAAQEYVMDWWDSMGGICSRFRGRFDGDRLTLESSMPQGGLCRSVFDLGSADRYTFTMEISPDGEQWAPAMDGAYERSGGRRDTADGKRQAADGSRQTATGSRQTVKAAARKKAPARKAPGKKAPARKAPGKKAPARKSPGRKAPAKKAPGRKRGVKTAARGRRR